jgi:GNAT superfamily N-acetyltransferase
MLSRSYWAKDRTREEVVASVENSLCFSLLKGETLVGFARVLTDKMAYAIILDMVLQDEFRGQGLGQWLVRAICDYPVIAPLRQLLWTGDADDFYRKGGFAEMPGLKFMARNWKMKI